ncbi:MAG TPA: hypothetical protein VMU95_00170 [Trebonia sp.]|nr:hypothetical protein [Trebonia sp.]
MRHRHLKQRVVADHGEPGRGDPEAAARSASRDGLPVTVRRQPVSDRIIAEIARDVPSDRPSAVAKNGVCDALYRVAPPQTAWTAASSAGMVNSGNQPARIASAAPASRAGGSTVIPASRSGAARPSPPRTITRPCPRRASMTAALLAGVIICSSGTSRPASRSTRAK